MGNAAPGGGGDGRAQVKPDLDWKRVFDVVASAAGLAALGPVLVGIAAAIVAQDGGPVFYRGVRVGRGGMPFRIFKFRTMVVGAENLGGSSTAASDRRVTRIGDLIRRYKVDELPQLINVLVGDMSLVGPRPEVQRFVDLFSDEERAILSVRPGMTDWASIWNRDEGAVIEKSGIADPDEAYAQVIRPTKIRLQLKYVRDRSLATDVKLILRTIRAVLDRSHDASDIAPPPGADPGTAR
ncbi:MAG: sugar transferase [Deltaproteobacteria bacterium]|nr:sugar transferase [Deltaproteobacteria bacterium]